jgi:hypothetical protein
MQEKFFEIIPPMINEYFIPKLCGWMGHIPEEEFDVISEDGEVNFVSFEIPTVSQPNKTMLYLVVRKLLGHDTPNYPQQVGDCTSFGSKNAVEKLQCVEIVSGGEREEFHPIFPPYFYGAGRVFIGNAQLGPNEDGASGAWMAAAVMKYGALRSDEAGVPTYSGQIARKWGYKPGPPANFVDVAKTFLVKSAARLRSFDEVVTAIANGYPVTIASNQGFNMMPSSTGFHEPGREPWPHQMCIIGADTQYKTPYGIIENNWGDSHGRLKDFDDNHDLPIGCLRVRAEIIDRMVKSGEAFAYSAFSGFPSKDDGWLDEALFDII